MQLYYFKHGPRHHRSALHLPPFQQIYYHELNSVSTSELDAVHARARGKKGVLNPLTSAQTKRTGVDDALLESVANTARCLTATTQRAYRDSTSGATWPRKMAAACETFTACSARPVLDRVVPAETALHRQRNSFRSRSSRKGEHTQAHQKAFLSRPAVQQGPTATQVVVR